MTSPVLALTVAFSVAVGTGGVGPALMGGLVLEAGLGPYLLLESGAVGFSVAVTLLESGLLPFLDRSVIGILESGLIPLLESGLIPLLESGLIPFRDRRLIRILESRPVTITVAGHGRRRILASGAVAALGGILDPIPNLIRISILIDRH